jgi:preprotein translocase subunit SecD
VLNFTKIKVTFVYLILLTLIFFASLNLKFNNSIEKKINLGLDLQGGSYILLEVDTNPLINQKIQSKVIPCPLIIMFNYII